MIRDPQRVKLIPPLGHSEISELERECGGVRRFGIGDQKSEHEQKLSLQKNFVP